MTIRNNYCIETTSENSTNQTPDEETRECDDIPVNNLKINNRNYT